MSTGLDAAAGIAGLISLCVTLFNGCVKGIAVIAAAQQADRSIERLNFMLELEQVRLLRWGERAGLCDDVQSNVKLNWDLVHQILEQLSADITDIKHLRERYSLDASETSSTDTSSPATVTPRDRNLVTRLWQQVSPKIAKNRIEIIQQKPGTLKKLRWVQYDQEKARLLISHISYFNNALQEMLHESYQESMKNDMEALLRDLISRSSKASELETIQAFIQPEAVAHSGALQIVSQIKQTRMYLGVDKKVGETSDIKLSRPSLTNIKYENLSKLETIEEGRIEIAEYKTSSKRAIHSYVLLEWKRAEKSVERQVKRRMMELTLLLATAHDSFHTLKCLGFLERKVPGTSTMYAYVFETNDLQVSAEARPNIIPKPLTLHDALKRSRKPTLSERLQMMLAVTENILQLHTTGWLHKGISSEHVLFIELADDGWQQGNAIGPYVAGYEFARHSVEETETMPFDERQWLYRHRALLDDNTSDSRFRKEYDLYSVGCILLELVLWRSLEDILSTDMTQARAEPATSHIEIHEEQKGANQKQYEQRYALSQAKIALTSLDTAAPILHEVAFAGGKYLRRAVELCFVSTSQSPGEHADGSPTSDKSDDDDAEASVEAQLEIVRILRSLCANV